MVTFAVANTERSRCKVVPRAQQPATALEEFSNESCGDIVQATVLEPVVASTHGFVHGVLEAYCHHHDLVLRPDDLWLAIMTQFGLFVNANANDLRQSLVAHDGSKELVVEAIGTLYSVDFGALSTQMVTHMEAHLVDPSLKDWILPSFSTTTDDDVIVGSVVLMATMKSFFSYKYVLRCGIPNVTLLGTTRDWEDVRRRLERLGSFGPRLARWATMLRRIVDQCVAAAQGAHDTDFWNSICTKIPGGSGPTYITGWISAFCVFDRDGQWQADKKPARSSDTSHDYPYVDTEDIPPGYLTVDATIDDNGVLHKAFLFAGHMAYRIGDDEASIAPVLSWAIALKNGPPPPTKTASRRK
ncbi:hypothetical protein SPRG_01319 [Saprolegnia parasitica CBS 223.65]|uniref:Uncharacterized protein n=1 Tax=Saprolegnia parasitica (strain CBS 223.65) TaxID=695850 RepID=A0A067CXQ4_SAPPC|nr:hypothetical protein SPRG_01319 [Saprolegnia parasitica CBS 223.65]KDO34045.1 hypothetical protein SPRG_01319 [Saprolegnia parasitica CBS 223.65]|eukprot:XP_012194930.1 hypothetical protein SPRG_01319 [Saprolegnia parasitica CBS 223.65]